MKTLKVSKIDLRMANRLRELGYKVILVSHTSVPQGPVVSKAYFYEKPIKKDIPILAPVHYVTHVCTIPHVLKTEGEKE